MPQSHLFISWLKYEGRDEYVRITNDGDAAQNMTGWSILSVVGNQRYHFPIGFVLEPGASVRIHSGPDAVDNPPTDLKWTDRYIWLNDGDKAELYNASGQLIDSYCYKAGCP